MKGARVMMLALLSTIPASAAEPPTARATQSAPAEREPAAVSDGISPADVTGARPSEAVQDAPQSAARVEGLVRTVALDSSRPLFIPTHPRITTTIRFPGAIDAPSGAVSVFTEDAERETGEYLVGWREGDPYFTITPIRAATMANLNVPYQGRTYVFYFYSADNPLGAAACVNLAPEARTAESASGSPDATPPSSSARVERRSVPLPDDYVALSPARLLGFLDRLKLIHATPAGEALDALARAMKVEVASSPETTGARGPGSSGIPTGMNDAGLYEVVLLRAVRDRRLNCIGFICLIRNTSDRPLTFDVSSFGARAGAEYLGQRVSDATPVLAPGAKSPAYFVVAARRNSPLRAANDWKITVDLVDPVVNPGAEVSRRFGDRSSGP